MGPQMNETGRGGRRVEAEAALMEGEGERKKVVLPRPCRSLSLSPSSDYGNDDDHRRVASTAQNAPRDLEERRAEERRGERRDLGLAAEEWRREKKTKRHRRSGKWNGEKDAAKG